jgi:acetolactate synthase-1/2/3 large subunit
MKLSAAIAEIMKRRDRNPAAIRSIIHRRCRQCRHPPVMVRRTHHSHGGAIRASPLGIDRRVLHAAWPGAENAMGVGAMLRRGSVLVLPMGYARRLANIDPNFNSSQAMKAFSKSSEPINIAMIPASPARSQTEERPRRAGDRQSQPTCGTWCRNR